MRRNKINYIIKGTIALSIIMLLVVSLGYVNKIQLKSEHFDQTTVDEVLAKNNNQNPEIEPEKPVVDEPEEPVVDEPKEPVVDEPEEPVVDEPEEPVVDKPKNEGKYSDKTIYLTFDDGPSHKTEEILDILDKYNVKATFFVVGREDDHSLNMYKEIIHRGHTLGMHSYSHKYDYIYKSYDNFIKDYKKIYNLLHTTTGIAPTIYRFPGGSLNGVSKTDIKEIIRYFNKNNIAYYDWNVLNGDAEQTKYTDKELVNNVISGVETKTSSNVLMHDSDDKEGTVRTLGEIIEILQDGGATFLPLDVESPKIQMIKSDSVN